MKVCVVGLWHLGSVTAACLAKLGHRVTGFDPDSRVIGDLQEAKPPLFEPGLSELVKEGLEHGNLSFSTDPAQALADAQVVWITYDTPVDEDDNADVQLVVSRVRNLFAHLAANAVVLISSQLVAGCTRQLQQAWDREHPQRTVDFAYTPENLRLGKALDVFLKPDRVVVGVRNARARAVVEGLLAPFAERIVWMSVESAEMTKHALNSFLAMSVSFANEIAAICEQVGADAKEVERGLKSEQRIGPGAYVGPGAAFAGGTLARDVQYLRSLGREHGQASILIGAIKESNDQHKRWTERKLSEQLGTLRGKRVAVLGLTYKPGTDTLRRSTAVELCRWLSEQGATVVAYDPRVPQVPAELAQTLLVQHSALAALEAADALVLATPWPEFRALRAGDILAAMKRPLVVDPNRFLAEMLQTDAIAYHGVGSPSQRHAKD